MFQKLIKTNESAAIAFIRIALGLLIFPHGAQKLLGWFGGYGFTGTMGFFTGTVHLPWIIGFLVIVLEFFGSLLLIAGLATRFVSALFVINFIGIILTAHLGNGFFMNWSGAQAGEGYEYHLLVIVMAAALLINGAGKFSLDKKLQIA